MSSWEKARVALAFVVLLLSVAVIVLIHLRGS